MRSKMDNHHSEASHQTSGSSRPLKFALVIVLGIMIIEVVGGILSNSLALSVMPDICWWMHWH